MREKLVLSQLIATAVAITLILRNLGWRRISRLTLSASDIRWLASFPLLQREWPIEKITPLVELASGVCPRNRCLVRSIMMVWLLRTRGVPAELRLGVRKRAGAFEAHAWTVSGDEIFADRPDAVNGFRTLTTSGKQ
jgi:hypothetical protein